MGVLLTSYCLWIAENNLLITNLTVVNVYWLRKWIHSFCTQVFLYFIQLKLNTDFANINFFLIFNYNCIKYKNTWVQNEWIHLRSQYTLTLSLTPRKYLAHGANFPPSVHAYFWIHSLWHCLEITSIYMYLYGKNGLTEDNSSVILYFFKLKYVPVI